MDSDRLDLVEHNLRLVVTIASAYENRGIPFIDLIHEGNLGLIKAAEIYDVEKHYGFPAFASFYIRQAIVRLFRDRS